ncbi:MAG: YeeE/YedE thiosulfate transporter family protein [Crocinitomicaceae bacterium]
MKEIYKSIIIDPWPWWVGGPLIGLFVIALLLLERKQLGISSSFQGICAKLSPIKFDYFKNVEKTYWQIWFSLGLILGGFVVFSLVPLYSVNVSDATIKTLESLNVSPQEGLVPSELYSFELKSMLVLLLGGLMIGFGARYANGCTAGHAIMGCAQMSKASIVSTIFFFVGGLIAVYFILPVLL